MIARRLFVVGLVVAGTSVAQVAGSGRAASAATHRAGTTAPAKPAPKAVGQAWWSSDGVRAKFSLPGVNTTSEAARTSIAAGSNSAILEVSSSEPLHDVVVSVHSTGMVILSQRRIVLRLVRPGKAAAVSIEFNVRPRGTGSISAEVDGLGPAGIPVRTTAAELDFAAGGGRVCVSLDGSLDAQAGALALEIPRIGRASYERRLAALMGGGATTQFWTTPSTPGTTRSTTIVKGTIEYSASDNSKHLVRSLMVQIVDADGTPNGSVVARPNTSPTGTYSATVSTLRSNGQPRKLIVRVLAEDSYFLIKPTAPATALPQHIDSTPHTATGAPITINVIGNDTADNNTAFDVADALLSGIIYLKHVNGGMAFRPLTVTFPDSAGTDFNSTTSSARILHTDRFDWDVILHEFGHYVADNFGIDTSRGGRHGFQQNLGEPPPAGYGKSAGIQLAWSEGFATYFAISAENVLNVAAMHIPHAGDTYYDDTEDPVKFHVDLQTATPYAGVGEDNELSVARTLWHIFKDRALAMSDLLILNTLKAAKANTLSAAIKALLPAGGAALFDGSGTQTAAYVKHSNDFACLLKDQVVSPKITAPANGTNAVPWSPPTYTWQPNGAGPSNRLDKFTVQFWSNDWSKMLFESPQQATTSYTPTAAEWKTIIDTKDLSGNLPASINVVVKGTGSHAPQTGPYKSCAINQPVVPVIKATPVDPQLGLLSYPSTPACPAEFLPTDINKFTLDADRLIPSTNYTLDLNYTATNFDVPLAGTYASDANGQITAQTVAIPIMPAQAWVLTATPAIAGPAPTTMVGVGWTSCIEWTTTHQVSVAAWGGAGVGPGTTVTESWDGTQESTTTASAQNASPPTDYGGNYNGPAYSLTCPSAAPTVSFSVTFLGGQTGTGQFAPGVITCAPTAPTVGGGTGPHYLVVVGSYGGRIRSFVSAPGTPARTGMRR